jgi:hypothetical protein
VVVVDVQVALALQGDVEPAVLSQLPEHMVEEPQPSFDIGLALTVKVYDGANASFLSSTADGADAAAIGNSSSSLH